MIDYTLVQAQGHPENSYAFRRCLSWAACSWTTPQNLMMCQSWESTLRLQFQTSYGYPKVWGNSNVHQGLPSKSVLGWRLRHHSTETARYGKQHVCRTSRRPEDLCVCFLAAGFTMVYHALPEIPIKHGNCKSNQYQYHIELQMALTLTVEKRSILQHIPIPPKAHLGSSKTLEGEKGSNEASKTYSYICINNSKHLLTHDTDPQHLLGKNHSL